MSDANTKTSALAILSLFTIGAFGLIYINNPQGAQNKSKELARESTLDFSINNTVCKYPDIVLAKIRNNTDYPIFQTSFTATARTKERSTNVYRQSFTTDLIIEPHTEKNICFEYRYNEYESILTPVEQKIDFVSKNYAYFQNLVYSVSEPNFYYGEK